MHRLQIIILVICVWAPGCSSCGKYDYRKTLAQVTRMSVYVWVEDPEKPEGEWGFTHAIDISDKVKIDAFVTGIEVKEYDDIEMIICECPGEVKFEFFNDETVVGSMTYHHRSTVLGLRTGELTPDGIEHVEKWLVSRITI